MSEVFISYRQTNDDQKQRVRAFAERLRLAVITVILDQFFLDDNPAGPNETWAKWSSDRALQSKYVLIIGTPEWFQCFEKTQPPGTGLGAACEADDLRTRIYEAGGLIKNIRVVLLDDADRAHMPGKLRGYHGFHAERDFENIVRWLGGKIPIDNTPHTSILHNLPSLQPFFGREAELKKIADALDPESRTWGALIDGPGGMGKTSLAVRAAYDAPPEDFEKIAFVSLKSRELDDDGVRDLSGFLISGLAELLNELARELGHADIAKASEEQRPRLLLDALRGTRTLLVLDNLESLLKIERDVVFTLIKKLPPGCKAILTSRVRIGSAAEELILERLDERAALDTLAELAERNPALARTSEAERLDLYRETGGKPLLLRWTAGQIGRGSCLTLSDAIEYLHSCPPGNDPLEFIFGDLVEDFSEAETRVLCALTNFNLPAKVGHISELAGHTEIDTELALRSVINRSLVVPSEELKTFNLVPLVGDFLRKQKPDVIAETGDRLEKRVYALVVESRYQGHDRFPLLDNAWPSIAAALPRFLVAPNIRLQTFCDALTKFLNFTGRWDEWLALWSDAEHRAVAEKDFQSAGWRSYEVGFIHYLRGESVPVLACAERTEIYWQKAQASVRERAIAIRLRGRAHESAKNYDAAIAAYREALELDLTINHESQDLAIGLCDLALAEANFGDLDGAERDFREALRIARQLEYTEGVVLFTGNLAAIAHKRKDWVVAEALARDALSLTDQVGRLQLIGQNYHCLADSLLRQGKKTEALPYARRAVEIYDQLGLQAVAHARMTLSQCESD